MEEQHAAEVLRQFAQNRAIVTSGQDRRWRWRPGTLLFPEGRCCYCGGVVRSNRIWVAEPGWLKGQLNISGEKAVWERPNHPHAGTDGGLCLGGTTDDLITVLFFGVNPVDTIRWHGRGRDAEAAAGVRTWYAEMFGHKCGEGEVLKAAEGIFAARTAVHRDRLPDCECGCGCNPARGNCGCECDDCVCGRQECVECGDTYDDNGYEGPDGRMYCQDCYYEHWVECDWCGRQVARADNDYITNEDGTWCVDHQNLEQRVWVWPPATPIAMEALWATTATTPPPFVRGTTTPVTATGGELERERAAQAIQQIQTATRRQRREERRQQAAREAARLGETAAIPVLTVDQMGEQIRAILGTPADDVDF